MERKKTHIIPDIIVRMQICENQSENHIIYGRLLRKLTDCVPGECAWEGESSLGLAIANNCSSLTLTPLPLPRTPSGTSTSAKGCRVRRRRALLPSAACSLTRRTSAGTASPQPCNSFELKAPGDFGGRARLVGFHPLAQPSRTRLPLARGAWHPQSPALRRGRYRLGKENN